MDNINDTIMNAASNVMYFCTAGKNRTGVDMESKDNLMVHPEVDIDSIIPHRENMERLLKWL